MRAAHPALLVILTLALAACGDDTAAAAGFGSATSAGAGGGGDGGGSPGGGGEGGALASTAASSTSSRSATTTGGGAFTLDVSTSLEGSTLVLHTNLPHHVGPCAALPFADAPCDDADGDGLVDAWEELALDRLRPFVILDEDEDLVDDPTFAVGLVGRVAPVGDLVHLYMMLGYARDFGSCGFTAHNGDSERVALAVAPRPGSDGDVAVALAYTAAHEGTSNDHGRVFQAADFGALTFLTDDATGEPRWAVYASANKHATYASLDICESVSSTPCLDEDCGPDGVDAATYTRLFPFVNAGEEAAPLTSDLGGLGFPGEDAWAQQDFCGGLGGDGCSSPVREKLLAAPF